MIHPSHGENIYISTKAAAFRKGHDGLAALVQSHLRKKPFDGVVYVFCAKWADRLKLIYWDGTGLAPLVVCKQTITGQCMAYTQREQRAFKWPTIRDGVLSLNPAQFEALFAGLDWRRVNPT